MHCLWDSDNQNSGSLQYFGYISYTKLNIWENLGPFLTLGRKFRQIDEVLIKFQSNLFLQVSSAQRETWERHVNDAWWDVAVKIGHHFMRKNASWFENGGIKELRILSVLATNSLVCRLGWIPLKVSSVGISFHHMFKFRIFNTSSQQEGLKFSVPGCFNLMFPAPCCFGPIYFRCFSAYFPVPGDPSFIHFFMYT